MKKIFIIPLILITLPIGAACLIDGGSNVCSIDNIRRPMSQTYTTAPFMGDPDDAPDARLNPRTNDYGENILREFGPRFNDYSYDSNCQFGVCNNPSGSPLFPFSGN